MNSTSIFVNGHNIPLIAVDAAVVGSGAAGLNAADWLSDYGVKSVAVFTEGINMGTSRNTGSDKQTYYKLSLSGNEMDSVAAMAADLFVDGVNGDNALAEAAGSVGSFIKLANLGVPFPTNLFGEYIGYKTDHDPRKRATSAGPLTSFFMTECLERSVRGKGIMIYDNFMAVKIITAKKCAAGLLCLNLKQLDSPTRGLTIVQTPNIVLATGGPAGCYLNSVYPESQTGMSGMAIEAGAQCANLDLWQYGLASLKFRWNVSGTYQQVLPRYISVDSAGDEREFLLDYFDDPCKALDMVFLKGYQWPFDSEKISGSSLIDILVHIETQQLGRRVYMDFRKNPSGLEDGFHGLSEEAYQYLANSGALSGLPIDRLKHMNTPAIALYKDNGIDLFSEPLEIGVCAQHNNGGLVVDADWQTTINGLYAAGEVAGTFGVTRPGGSALNSTQVGSHRAAEHIAFKKKQPNSSEIDFTTFAAKASAVLLEEMESMLKNDPLPSQRSDVCAEMSACAAHMRDPARMAKLESKIKNILSGYFQTTSAETPQNLPDALRTRDILITQLAILSAMQKAAEVTGSRGSALVLSDTGAPILPLPGLSYSPNKPLSDNTLLNTALTDTGFISEFKPVRPFPDSEQWFESAWAQFRERRRL